MNTTRKSASCTGKYVVIMSTGSVAPVPLLYYRAILAKDYTLPYFQKTVMLTYICPQAFPIVKLKSNYY